MKLVTNQLWFIHAAAIAEGFCSYVPDKTPDAPSKEELLANKAERLKQELDKAADHCIETFRTETLKL